MDDFDAALYIALKGGYIAEAEQFFRLLFPKHAIKELSEHGIELKVIITCCCVVDIPGSIIDNQDVDSSLLSATLQSPLQCHLGFNSSEL